MRIDPSPPLSESYLRLPLAHRGYHDAESGRPENSRAAILAAVQAGYGIEIDLQLSADKEVMVFHDYHLNRLTGRTGAVRQLTARELGSVQLLNGAEGIPTLAEILDIVSGNAPLLIEIKDQDGNMGPKVGPLEIRLAEALTSYDGPVAVMSFNPHAVRAFAEAAPGIPRGLTTGRYLQEDWKMLSDKTREKLRGIPDFHPLGAAFISHSAKGLSMPEVQNLKARGVPILCWTVRSFEEEIEARQIADNVTFEGYAPAIPAA